MQTLTQNGLFSDFNIALKPQIDRRRALIKEMWECINEERKCGYYVVLGVKKAIKPLSAKAIAVKVGHLKDFEDLNFLASICRQEKARGGFFLKVWGGSLKKHGIK